MASEKMGTVECPWGTPELPCEGSVRKDKNGYLFILCRHGQHFLKTPEGQEAITDRYQAFGTERKPRVEAPASDNVSAPAPTESKPSSNKSRSKLKAGPAMTAPKAESVPATPPAAPPPKKERRTSDYME